MKLSTRARYALRMMLDVAQYGNDERPVPLARVAHRTDLSRGYLEQLALGLRRARLLRGVAGRKGGYRLALPASQIHVSDVVEASVGPISIVDCVAEPGICSRSSRCECRVLYSLINRRITEELRAHTLADLMDPAWARRHGDAFFSMPLAEGEGDPCSAVPVRRRGRPRMAKGRVTSEDVSNGGTKDPGQDRPRRAG